MLLPLVPEAEKLIAKRDYFSIVLRGLICIAITRLPFLWLDIILLPISLYIGYVLFTGVIIYIHLHSISVLRSQFIPNRYLIAKRRLYMTIGILTVIGYNGLLWSVPDIAVSLWLGGFVMHVVFYLTQTIKLHRFLTNNTPRVEVGKESYYFEA